MLQKIQPKDIIAILCIVAFVILKLKGLDGTVNGAFMLILGYYFAKRVEGKDNGK